MIERREARLQEIRRFGMAAGTLLAVLFGAALPWLFGRPWSLWPWALGLGLFLWGLLHPASLGPVHGASIRLGHLIGRVTTPVILAVAYVVAVLPTGLIRRMLGRDSMARTFDPSAASYRIASTRRSVRDLEKPY